MHCSYTVCVPAIRPAKPPGRGVRLTKKLRPLELPSNDLSASPTPWT